MSIYIPTLSGPQIRSLNRRYRSVAADEQDIDRLNNKNYENFLYSKYKKYYVPGLFSVRDALLDTWILLHNAVSSTEFTKTGASDISPYANGGMKSLSMVNKHILASMANENYYFKRFEKSVEIRISLPPIAFFVGYGGFTLDQSQFADKAREQAERIIHSFLPDFVMPNSWTTDTSEETGIKETKPQFTTVVSKRTLLEQLAKINIPFTPNIGWEDSPRELKLPEDYISNFKHAVSLEFEIANESASVLNPQFSLGKANGTLGRSGSTCRFELTIRAYLNFPLEYALWSTCTIKPEQFIERLFYDYVQGLWRRTVESKSTANYPERISNLTAVKNVNDSRIANLKFNPRPHTNKEGYAILGNAQIMYLPTVDNVSSYTMTIKNSYDAGNNTINAVSDDLKKLRKQLRNAPVYTDWLHNRFSYVNEANKLIIISLEGSIPLDEVTIHRLFETSIFAKAEDPRSLFPSQAFFNVIKTNLVNLNINIKDITDRQGPFESVDKMFSFLEDSGAEITFYHLAGQSLDPGFKKAQDVLDNLREIVRRAYDVFDQFPISITQRYEYMRLGFDLVLTYGKDYDKYERKYFEETQKNRTDRYGYEDTSKFGKQGVFDFYNLKGVQSLLPHQAEIIASNGKGPKYDVKSVSPGGGKSILSIIDILMEMALNRVKRPLVAVPGRLVSEYVNEINKFSAGHLNAFPLTLETVRDKLMGTLGMNVEQIINYIRTMPANTIFITSYSFISSTSDLETGRPAKVMIYGNEELQVYPITEVLRRIGFDILVMDESHNIKTRGTQRSRALAILACEIPLRRIMTGTIISNTPMDIVGQTAFINPLIFGTEANFAGKYGRTLDDGGKRGRRKLSKNVKVLSWSSSLRSGVSRELRPYAQYHHKTRRDWAFMLPKIEENVIPVPYSFTQKQKEYYDNLMSEAYGIIRADPKLMQKMERGAPEDEDYIENQLRRHLSKVEIFLNAPSEDPVYSVMVGDPDDIVNLRSPKSKLIDDLLTLHFEGGRSKLFANDYVVEKSLNKVIVFGYNRAIATHLFKFTKFREIALCYQAGDMDALAKFRDPNSRYKIFFAAENSIKEGFNLQVADYLIRVQPLWSPGPQDQAVSRIFRPDVGDKYKRDKIRYDWLIQENTIDIPKAARLISKIIDKAKSDFGDELPTPIKEAPLEIIKMNLDIIKRYRTFEDIEEARGSNYLQTYQSLVEWEAQSHQKTIAKMRAVKEKELGRTITDQELKTLAMIPVQSTQDLPGSKKVYVPRISGADIYSNHPVKVKPASLARFNTKDDEDEEDAIDGDILPPESDVTINPGDYVDTEFGPGIVIRVTGTTAKIKIKGFIKPLILQKATVGIPIDEDEAKKLKKLIKSDLGNSLLPPGFPIKNINKTLSKPDDNQNGEQPETSVETSLPLEPKNPDKLNIEVAVVNGIPTLWAIMTKEDIPILTRKQNWKAIPPFVAAQVRRGQGITTLLEYLDEKHLTISDGNKELLLDIAHKMSTGRLMIANKINFSTRWRDFFSTAHKRVSSRRMVRLYPFIWENKVYVAANIRVHNPNDIARLIAMPAKNGIKRFQKFNYETLLFPFNQKREALDQLKEINKQVPIENIENVTHQIRKLTLT